MDITVILVILSIIAGQITSVTNRTTTKVQVCDEVDENAVGEVYWTLFAAFPTDGDLFYRQQLVRPA